MSWPGKTQGFKVKRTFREELKIKPGGGEKINRLLAGTQGKLPKEKSIERLISLLETFHRRMNNVFLQQLMEKTGETANLVILDEGEAIYIEKVESPASLRMFYRIGKQAPAHATGVGKVMLSALPSEKVKEIIKSKGLCKLNENTITSPEKLQRELEKIHENGFAIDNKECEVGAKYIAAPIRDYTNQVVAAISISGPSARLSEERLNELAEVVKDIPYKISQKIGYLGRILGYRTSIELASSRN